VSKTRVDFKRHKDVVAYFNQHYVATEKFNRNLGRRIGRLKTMREDCDYDDFFVVCPTRGVENLGKSAEENVCGLFLVHRKWQRNLLWARASGHLLISEQTPLRG
jgi:hypothetical protein